MVDRGRWALDLFMGRESRPHRDNRTRIPYLAPEIQPLYKARRPRSEDDADFGNVAPRLDEGGRSFLHDALAGIDPHHPWLEVLAAPRGKECA